jgi:hypothetical protein
MAGRFSTIALFIYLFQIALAILSSMNFLGVVSLPSDSANVGPTLLGAAIHTSTCGAIPLSCTSILLVGGALVGSVLFFGAWAFGMSLWIGFYGAALADLHITLVYVLGFPVAQAALVDLVALAAFAGDMIYMYSWRDINAG